MKKILSAVLSSLFLAGDVSMWIWLISFLFNVGIVGAVQQFVLWTVLLWICFAVLMGLKRRAETRAWPKWIVKLLRWLFVPGYVFDCWYNTRHGTLAFLELPPVRENKVLGITIRHRFEPFTSRLKRHYHVAGWRGNEARVFCFLIHLIDKEHCK